MSRDQITITRAEAIRQRRESEQKRTATRKNPPKPKPAGTRAKIATKTLRLTPASSTRLRRRYDIAMSATPRRAAGIPAFEIPAIAIPEVRYGPRWISFLLLAACIALIYAMFNAEAYVVQSVTILGNQRIPAGEIETILGVRHQPSFLLNPAQVEYNVLVAYPEIYSVDVKISLPAKVVLQIHERQPILAWDQSGVVKWVDEQGYAFSPRGAVAGLAHISANGAAPTPLIVGITPITIGAQPFITPELARSVAELAPAVPEGATLVYDPEYGLGWDDPRGWHVYFGQTGAEMPVKLEVYQSLVNHLMENDLQPAIISVEYPSAPFYRLNE